MLSFIGSLSFAPATGGPSCCSSCLKPVSSEGLLNDSQRVLFLQCGGKCPEFWQTTDAKSDNVAGQTWNGGREDGAPAASSRPEQQGYGWQAEKEGTRNT